MPRNRSDAFKTGDISPSTLRPYEKRFDLPPRPVEPPNPFDVARDALEAVTGPRHAALKFWAQHALEARAMRPGYEYDTNPTFGGTRSDDLAEMATVDCGFEVGNNALKGACIVYAGLFPIVNRANTRVWVLPVAYVGLTGADAATMANLRADIDGLDG